MTEKDILIKILNSLNGNKVCLGKEEITVNATVKSLTLPTGCNYALLAFESSVTSGITGRFFEDGSSPSTTSGIFLSHGDKFDITNAESLSKFKVVQAQAGTHKLTVQYYK